MDNCTLPLGVSALACAIAQQTEDNIELAFYAALFVELGDTLATIVSQRELRERCAAKQESNC